MEAKFNNGSTVSRLWGKNEETELLAAFQYSTDAIEFARRKVDEDADIKRHSCSYIVASHNDGTVLFIGQPVAEDSE